MILLWIGLDPNTPTDRDDLVRGLERLLDTEPSLSVRPGANGSVLLGATRDDQLEAIVDRRAREFDVQATTTSIRHGKRSAGPRRSRAKTQ